MKAKDVNPWNFKVKSILYETASFSIAYGEWKEEYDCIAMRWNGEDKHDAGYPKTFGHPVWFIIPDELTVAISKSLLETKNCNKKEILNVLGIEYDI